MTIGRIRVLVAGDIYVNRSLVRPFLEDDGYEVVGEPLTRDEALTAVGAQQLDAVVIDDRLLSSRGNGKLLHKVRRAAPEAKVVVISSAGGRPKGVAGVDAYLERGMSLAALSAILGGFFAADDLALAAAGAGAVVAASGSGRSPEPRGGVARFVAAVGMPIVVAWALIAIVATGGGRPVPRADTTDLGGDVVIVPQGVDRLDDAHASLDAMIEAIEAGNYPLATIRAKTLMDQRATAIAGGYLTIDLDQGDPAPAGRPRERPARERDLDAAGDPRQPVPRARERGDAGWRVGRDPRSRHRHGRHRDLDRRGRPDGGRRRHHGRRWRRQRRWWRRRWRRR